MKVIALSFVLTVSAGALLASNEAFVALVGLACRLLGVMQ